MIPDYITIGHITKDILADGSYTPGGTVTFAALAARNLGAHAAILTAAPGDLRALPLYHNIEIRGPETEVATVFENIYKPEGRHQFVRAVAPVIRPQDVPEEWRGDGQIVHLAPVAQECAPGLVKLFSNAIIGVTPQGFMREWDSKTGLVSAIEWAGAKELLPQVSALILSSEDLPAGKQGQAMLKQFIELCPVVAYTRGVEGCVIFCNGTATRVPAYPAREIDPTGAGDVFAAAFLMHLRSSSDPLAAARYANAAAACNIEKPGATGVPTPDEVAARLRLSPLE
ncbi:MAG TPA: PfkB family carbohydrate kinase [Chloroflexia bacterium]|nr:PfkB family carbohydrate kinase [Chloroflexia bacterium]